MRAFAIEPQCFRRFLRSMAMDLSVATYETFDDLLDYMEGSAAVIGEMMLPILEPAATEAATHARDLGIAFQLTNFLRDVAQDLDRVYIPQGDLRKFGATTAVAQRRSTTGWRDLLAFEIARTRQFYASADLGVAPLPPTSARCIRGARLLYSGILDQIEAATTTCPAAGWVPTWRKIAVASRLSYVYA